MDLTKKIKIRNDIEITVIEGKKALLDFNAGSCYIIKGVGNDILDMLHEEITINGIVDKLLTEYDVSREECERSVTDFLKELEKADFI